MNKFITSVVFLFFGVIAGAQSQNFYYYKNNKVPIELDRTGLTLIVEESFSVSDLRAYNFKPFEFQIDSTNNNTDKYAVIDLSNTVNQSEYRQLLKTLNAIPNVIKANPNFKNSVDEDIGLSNYFYVKLKSPSDFHVLQSEASRNNVIIFEQNKFMPLWYTLKVTKNTIGSTLEVANRFYETGLFASSQPDFLADDIACSDDPMFGSLWGLHNSSNPDYDINICEAWNITEGENINVAVLDTGIEKTHGDLNANMSPLSFNTETGTSPSQVFGDHGTHCAGIIAAEKDNNTQVVGVAPKAKLMDVSNSLLSTANSRMKRADGINWAWQNGADVISNSWGSTIMYDVIDDAIDNALQNGRDGKGTLIVFASGNDYNNVVSYPANSNPDILAVGSITSSGNRSDFSNYGNQLDVVAPGSNILSTVLNNEIDYNSGTSMATPHVSGVAALILSVNPNLTAKQVQDIIESTAQKIGNYSYTNTAGRTNGDWNEQMGYGLIDAYAAVQMAQLDLYIKDCPTDFGQEPSGCVDFWDSPDIWVRNNQDGQTENQNPVYRPSGTPNYIYVKVRNLSGVPSSGSEKLKIYWAKANTSYAWPDYWNGTAVNDQGIPLSSELPSVDIPVIQPGQEVVVAVPWVVPNPENYSDMEEPWHYCIMARVESENDPMTFPETADSGENIRNNNNIAQKNVSIVNPSPGNPIGATVGVGNAFPVSRDFVFEFQDKTETGKFLYREAEITIRLDDRLLQTWKNSGGALNNMKQVSDNTFLITDNNASFGSLKFEPHQIDLLTLNFNFLTSEITDKDQFIYNVVQKDLQGNVVGGETYEIRKNNSRTLFFADVAGETEVNKNEPVVLIAESINEPAIYNWYNDEGELVYEGIDFTTSVAMGKEYKLEVIALSDGYKDYSDVALTLKPNAIETIYPNPATADVITVDYKINEGTSAYLSITGTYMSNVSNNYILDTNQDQIAINVSNYPLGAYIITLVTDGNISDSENLIIH